MPCLFQLCRQMLSHFVHQRVEPPRQGFYSGLLFRILQTVSRQSTIVTNRQIKKKLIERVSIQPIPSGRLAQMFCDI